MNLLKLAGPAALVAIVAAAVTGSVHSAHSAQASSPPAGCGSSSLPAGNGSQQKGGFCSDVPVGEVPGVEHLPSLLLVNPKNGQSVKRNMPFNVDVKVANVATGHAADPATGYANEPATVDGDGNARGHVKVAIQKLNGNNVPDAKVFAFFKGTLGDKAGNGLLSVAVENGLPERGTYRICADPHGTNHLPVPRAVAQAGAPGDCIRINVV